MQGRFQRRATCRQACQECTAEPERTRRRRGEHWPNRPLYNPEPFRQMGSLEFAKHLLAEAKVAVAPGIGFGGAGDGHVRFALVENEHRIRQAARGIKKALEMGPKA